MNGNADWGLLEVAPRVGAWIETWKVRSDLRRIPESHPVWVRGLKQSAGMICDYIGLVAPRVGAWIETTIHKIKLEYGESHPVWVRGLKP